MVDSLWPCATLSIDHSLLLLAKLELTLYTRVNASDLSFFLTCLLLILLFFKDVWFKMAA